MGSPHRNERGEGKIGCMLTLLVLIMAVAAALKLVPVFYSNSSLADAAGDIAGEAGLYPVPALVVKLRSKAAELNIPEALEDGAMTVATTGSKSAGTCTVTFNYTRAVDFYSFYSLNIETHKVVTRPYMDAR